MDDKLSPGLDRAGRGADEARRRLEFLKTELAGLRAAGQEASSGLDMSGNIARIKELEKEIDALESKLKDLPKPDLVPDGADQAVRQYNGLNNSVQQIVRELPAASVGLNTFFLAISNNLPILTDEIKRAKVANDALSASGQQGVPVWKQLMSSIFSWQSLMMVGITVLSMYGKEIISWIGNLFKTKDSINAVRQEQEALNAAMTESRNNAAKEQAGLRTLYAMTQNTAASMKDRTAAVRELQNRYPAYFGNLKTEAILAGNAAAQYRQLTNDIMQAAYARAYEQRISQLAEQNINELRGSQADYNWLQQNRKAYEAAKKQNRDTSETRRGTFGSSYSLAVQTGLDNLAKEQIREYEERQARWQRHNENYKRNEAAMAEYEKQILKRQSAVMKTEQGTAYLSGSTKTDKQAEQETTARLNAIEQLDEKTLGLRRKNQQEEISLMADGTEKKLRQIDQDYKEQADEIAKQAAELAKANKNAGTKGLNGNSLTTEQQNEIDKANRLNEEKKKQSEAELLKAEAQTMQEYLRQYGTYQQQKLAIAEEYAEKIKQAQTEGERLALEKQQAAALQNVDVAAIKQNIDWGSVFGDFGTMFKEQLQPAIDQLKTIVHSDSFKSSSLQDQQALYELIAKLEQSAATFDGDIFKKVSGDIMQYQDTMRSYNAAIEKERAATERLTAAKARLAEAEKNGGDTDEAQREVEAAQAGLAAASESVNDFGAQVQQTTADLQASSSQAVTMFHSLASGLQGLASGSLQGIGSGLMTLDKLFGGDLTKNAGNALAKGFQSLLGKDSQASKALTEALGNTGMAGEIISAVLGMLDMIAENGISGIITGLQDTIFNSVNKMLDDVLSGDIIARPFMNAVRGVGNILNTVTFGGLESWLGSKESDPRLSDDIAKLTEQNESLTSAIERLTEVMDDATVEKSKDLYEQQKAALEQREANTREEMQRSAAAYKNSNIFGNGGHASSNSKINAGMSEDDWAAISAVLGYDITGGWTKKNYGPFIKYNDIASAFFNLSTEDMYKVSTDAAAQFEKLKSLANDGYKDAAQFMDEYIGYAKEADELLDGYREKVTGISFNGVRDSFSSMLKDMGSSLDDFTEDIDDKLLDAVVEGMMSDRYTDKLRTWYGNFAEAMSGGLTDAEAKALRAEYEQIAKDAVAERDALVGTLGIKDTASGTGQSAEAGGFTAMTQDQGTELKGLFTSGLQHWSSMDARLEDVSTRMDIAEGHLARIEENTGASAGYLKKIMDDVLKIVRDGVKVK